jgi:hypothetical protein
MTERTLPQRALPGPSKAIHCKTTKLVNTTKLHHPAVGVWKTTNQQTVASSFQSSSGRPYGLWFKGTNSQVHTYMVWKPNLRSSSVTPCFSLGTLHALNHGALPTSSQKTRPEYHPSSTQVWSEKRALLTTPASLWQTRCTWRLAGLSSEPLRLQWRSYANQQVRLENSDAV